MAKDFRCETCGRPAERLFQSYTNGRWEDADCSILDAESPDHITARVRAKYEDRITGK